MGLRFRRSLKIAPGLKLNLNKKSASITAGKRGAHFTANSKGKKTTSIGIPGTGLSYVKTSGGNTPAKKAKTSSSSVVNISAEEESMKRKSNGSEKKKGSCLPKVIGAFLIIGLIGAFIPKVKIESIELSVPNYQNEYDINSKIPFEITVSPENASTSSIEYVVSDDSISVNSNNIQIGSSEGSFDIYAKSGDILSNTITIHVIDIEARKAEQQRIADETAKEAEEKAAQEVEAQKAAEAQAVKEAEEKKLAEEEAAQKAEQQKLAEENSSQDISSQQPTESNNDTPSSVGNGENFNSYDNTEQQQTTATYVLNTSTHKFHYPSCKSVKKIAPQNYSTSNDSRDELISQGYDSCGICKP